MSLRISLIFEKVRNIQRYSMIFEDILKEYMILGDILKDILNILRYSAMMKDILEEILNIRILNDIQGYP